MREIRNPAEIDTALDQISQEIHARVGDAPLAVVGIHTGGVPIARRLRERLKAEHPDVALGQVDVMLYRDDAGLPIRGPGSFGTEIDFDVDGCHIILVDDVLFTGRTVRAAIDQIVDFGRPSKIELAVLVDRGHRQLPIQADYTGFTVETKHGDHVRVCLAELGQEDSVRLTPEGARATGSDVSRHKR